MRSPLTVVRCGVLGPEDWGWCAHPHIRKERECVGHPASAIRILLNGTGFRSLCPMPCSSLTPSPALPRIPLGAVESLSKPLHLKNLEGRFGSSLRSICQQGQRADGNGKS